MNMFTDLKTLLYVLYIGVLIGVFYTYYQKKFIGGFIRRLAKNKAFDKDSAVSFVELGYKQKGLMSAILTKALNGKSGLSRVVKRHEGRFYLPVESKDITIQRYNDKGTTLLSVILAIIVFFLLISFAFSVIPPLTKMAGSLPNAFKGNNADMSGYTEFEDNNDLEDTIKFLEENTNDN